jgi:hypothetical protein
MSRRAILRRRAAPKHRGERAATPPRVKHRILVGGAATVVSAAAAVAGLVALDAEPSQSLMVSEVAHPVDPGVAAQQAAERHTNLSRSAERQPVEQKVNLFRRQNQTGKAVTQTVDLNTGDPKAIAQAMLPEFGFSSSEFSCLDSLWEKESGWDPHAANPSSGAYGIPQSLPGSKMATAGSDWETNPATQIRWGLGYIKGSYGTPCAAWSHSESYGWY